MKRTRHGPEQTIRSSARAGPLVRTRTVRMEASPRIFSCGAIGPESLGLPTDGDTVTRQLGTRRGVTLLEKCTSRESAAPLCTAGYAATFAMRIVPHAFAPSMKAPVDRDTGGAGRHRI